MKPIPTVQVSTAQPAPLKQKRLTAPMTVDELHKLQMSKLIRSFGVSTAMSAFRNDRAARALGNHYSEER
jgi:hypothetical protein